METPQIKFLTNIDYPVTLLYDSPKTGDGEYGIWHRYAVKHNEDECCIFASDGLNAQLTHYRTNDSVNILKKEYEPGKTKFVVTGINGTNTIDPENPPVKAQNSPLNAVSKLNPTLMIDDRTHDIHRQVAFKEACKMFGPTDETLSDDQLSIIKANTDSLLANVLEYLAPIIDDDDVPF